MTVPSLPRRCGVARRHDIHRISGATGELSVLVLIGIAIVLVAVSGLGLYAVRRRRTRDELPDDWWPAFEHDFRAYARRVTLPEHDRPRRQRDGGPRGR
jgi:hypothetical protein